jgi:hypothetical protein
MPTTTDLLCLAASALRDIREGWPLDELAAPGGNIGLDPLLTEIVTHLRGQGINDDQGWDCEITATIPVATPMPSTYPVVVLCMEGGVIHEVIGNAPLRVVVLDADTEGGDEENIVTLENEEVYLIEHQVSFASETLVPERVQAIVAEVDAHYAEVVGHE